MEHSADQSMAKQNHLGDFIDKISKDTEWPAKLRIMKMRARADCHSRKKIRLARLVSDEASDDSSEISSYDSE